MNRREDVATTPADIWQFHERVVGAQDLAIRCCKRLESGKFNLHDLEPRTYPRDPEFEGMNDFERLEAACRPGPGDAEIKWALGVAAGSEGNPLNENLHAKVVRLCRDLMHAMRNPDLLYWRVGEEGLDEHAQRSLERCAGEEVVQIACEHRKHFEAITAEDLKAEARAACCALTDLDSLNGRSTAELPVAQAKLDTETRTKRTQHSPPGSADPKIISALCKHHKYEPVSCENMDPIGTNDLKTLARVSAGSVTNFWKRRFGKDDHVGSYADYERACHNHTIPIMLALWQGEAPTQEACQLIEDRVAARLEQEAEDRY